MNYLSGTEASPITGGAFLCDSLVLRFLELDDIIENDMEGFDDILTERLVGLNCCLSEISYDVVGVEPDENFLHIRVSGYVDDVDCLESQCDK